MNLPSLDKFESTVVPGGKIFVDSTLIERKVERTDVEVFYVPATQLALEIGLPTLANMVLVGKLIRETGVVDYNGIEEALKKVVSAKHADLLDANRKAMQTGYEF